MKARAILALVCLLVACGQGQVGGGGDDSVDPPPSPTPGPADLPEPETCDQLDNDQDGEVDEGCACNPALSPEQACYTGPAATRNVGQCQDGSQPCQGGGEFSSWGVCSGSVLPETEVCGDKIDNDCNGKVDDAPGCVCDPGATQECYSGPPGTKGVGQCKAGEQVCAASGEGWEPGCAGEVLPEAAEVCGDKIDNDCNGMVDEGCIAPQLPVACTVATLKHVHGVGDCDPNQAAYMMDDGTGPNFICCPLPATDILSADPAQVRYGACGPNEVITGATGVRTFKCTKINTNRYTLAGPQKPCYFGSGAAGGSGVSGCSNHPHAWSVLQDNLFGSDGCSGHPYGALFVSQGGKDCEDLRAAQLRYTGAVAGDPAGGAVVMFQ